MTSNQNIFDPKVAIIMFVAFTPYSFFYLVFYISFLFTFFVSTRFYWCWISMEIIILFFIGICYTLFPNSFHSLLVYFLVQAFSSFSLLIFYIFYIPFFFTSSLLLKLSLFPFHSWFITSVYSFPNFVLFLVSTFHKLPIFIIVVLYPLPLNFSLLWLSIFFTFLVSGFFMLRIRDFRLLLVLSSVGNNSWFFLRAFSGMQTFLVFSLVYIITLFLLFFSLGSSSKPYLFNFHYNSSPTNITNLIFVSLSGLPPFPLFFSKIYIIYSLFIYTELSSSLLLLSLLSSSFLLIAYLSILIKIVVYSYTTLSTFIFSVTIK